MTGWCRIENHVIVFLRSCLIAEQQRKLVECRNFDRTSAGQPFFEQIELLRRQNASIRRNRPFPVLASSLIGIDVHRLKVEHSGNGRRLILQFRAKDSIKVRRWIGTHQEDSPPIVSQQHCACTCE